MFKHCVSTGLALLLGACMGADASEMVLQSDLSKLQQKTGGVWASDGYGYILDLRGGETVYNKTDVSCLALSPEQESPMEYFDRFQINYAKTQLALFNTREPYKIVFNEIGSLPEACQQSPSTNPLDIFDAFAEIYREHYAFFDVHGVNWDEQISQMRSGLSDTSGEMDLVERFIGILSQLKDGHVSISATVDGDEGQFIAYPGPTMAAVEAAIEPSGKNPNSVFGEQYLRRDIEDSILGGYGMNAVNERLKYGITSDDIGYLAVMAEGGYTGDETAAFEEELAALQPAMDLIIKTFKAKDVKAIIIDLSVNHGGYDYLGRAIAGSFTDKTVPAYTKYAADAQDQTPYQLSITPAKGARYTGPVYVMTSDATVSAGETLTLSLRALPNVTHVGMPTRGALSDVLVKYLPNGWEVTLSNEVYTDQSGEVWEGRGIEPEIEIEVFDPENPLSGHMPAITKLVQIIDERH